MTEKKASNSSLRALLTLFVLIAGIWYFYGGGIEHQVAQDQIRQYEIAKRSGNAIDASVQAGIVAAAFLQAKDEDNYRRWKQIEADEMRRAGIPSP